MDAEMVLRMKLRDTGGIDDETYLKLRKVVERLFEIDLGEIFARYGVSGNSLVLDVAAGGSIRISTRSPYIEKLQLDMRLVAAYIVFIAEGNLRGYFGSLIW